MHNSIVPSSIPSLCIPRISNLITKEQILSIISKISLGDIDHIDVVPKQNENGDKYQRVFIHFKNWYNSPNSIRARQRLLSGKEIKIIYDEPWFWKISANRSSYNTNINIPYLNDNDLYSSDDDEKLIHRKNINQNKDKSIQSLDCSDNDGWTTIRNKKTLL